MSSIPQEDRARMRRYLLDLRLDCGETELYRDFINTLNALDVAEAHIVKLEAKLHPKKGEKRVYGDECNVLLTDSECERLWSDYGQARTDSAIAFLDLHIGAKGKDTYKNHYLALRKWVFDAIDEREARAARARDNPKHP